MNARHRSSLLHAASLLLAGCYTCAGGLPNPWMANTTGWYPFTATGSTEAGELGLNAAGAGWLTPIPSNSTARVLRSADDLTYNGQPIKFIGTNLSAPFDLDSTEASRYADFYAKYGVNLIRLHKFLEQWSTMTTDTSWVDMDHNGTGFANFDNLVWQLKQRGIFLNISPSWHFTIKSDDMARVPYWREFYDSFAQGSPVVAQVVQNNRTTKNSGTFSLRAKNKGDGLQIVARVYGINGNFTLDISKLTPPQVSDAQSTVTLLKELKLTANTGDEFSSLSSSVNFGANGYQYLVVLAATQGFRDNKLQQLDDFFLGQGTTNLLANAAFASNDFTKGDTVRNLANDNDKETTLVLDRKWHLFNTTAWAWKDGALKADGGLLDHPKRPAVVTEMGYASIPSFVYFLPEFEKMKIDQTKDFLSHRNPYTGKTYAQDPVIAFVEMHNETSIGWLNGYLGVSSMQTLRTKACADFCQWIKTTLKVTKQSDLAARWGTDAFSMGATLADKPTTPWIEGGFSNQNLEAGTIPPWVPTPSQLAPSHAYYQRSLDTLRFLFETQGNYYARFQNALKNIAPVYNGLTIAANWTWSSNASHYLNLYCDREIGVVDRHEYTPTENQSALDVPGSAQLAKLSNVQVKDRPTMMSEWGRQWSNPGTVETRFINAAYGLGLQGWDAMTYFPGIEDVPANPVPSTLAFDTQFLNPGCLPALPFIARQVIRGDVHEGADADLVQRKVYKDALYTKNGSLGFADSEITTKLGDGELSQIQASTTDATPTVLIPEYTPAIAKLATTFTTSQVATPQVDLGDYIEKVGSETIYHATNGQLAWKVGAQTFDSNIRVDTPETQGVCGYFDSGDIIELANVQIKILNRSQFVSIYVTASEKNKTIANSSKILVLAIGRSRNTNMAYAQDTGKVTNAGTSPVLMEPVNAQVTFKNRTQTMTGTLLTHDGMAGNAVGVDNTNKRLTINGSTHKTPYYLIKF